MSAGDDISVNITLQSNMSATVEITNWSQNTYMSSPIGTSDPDLAMNANQAEWIVEDPTVGSSFALFAKYTRVQFRDCVAGTNGTSDPAGLVDSSLYSMIQGTKILSEPHIVNSTALNVHYG